MILPRRSPPATAPPAARLRRRTGFIWCGWSIEISRLTPFPHCDLIPIPCPLRGALMRRLEGGTDRKEWAGDMALLLRWDGAGLIPGLDLGAAPAGRFSHNLHSGGVEPRPPGTNDPGARSSQPASANAPGERGPTPEGERRQWSAGRRAPFRQRARHVLADVALNVDAPFGAPLPSCLGSKRLGPAQAGRRRRTRRRKEHGRRSVGFLTIEQSSFRGALKARTRNPDTRNSACIWIPDSLAPAWLPE